MSKHAAAILHIPQTLVRDTLAATDRDDVRVGANGENVEIHALRDATIVHLGIGIEAEPDELAERLRALLGDLLDEHEEARGVPIYPSSYELQADRWDAAVEELGEAADWVRVHEEAPQGVADMLSAFGLGSTDLAAVQAELAKGDQSQLFASAMRMAQQMADSGALEDLAKRMGIGEGADPFKGLEGLVPGGVGGLDLEEITRQARKMLESDPELEERIRKVVAPGGEPSEGEEPDGTDEEKKG